MTGPERDSGLPARALGSLYLAGAAIGLISVLLPHAPRADVPGLYSNIVIAFVGGVALWTLRRHVPGWALQVSLVIGTLLITRAVLLSGERVSFYSVWFIWVGLYAFYFFSRPAAAAHVALVAVMYAITIAQEPASSPVARWLTTVATLIVAGAFIDTLVRRARHEASAAAANADRMTRIAEVAHRLAALSDITAARPTLCETTVQMVGAEGAALWELAPEGRGLKLSASSGLKPTDPVIRLSAPAAGATQAFVTGRPSWTSGASAAALCAEFGSLGRTPGSCLWQPVLCEQTPIAVLATYWDDPRALEDPSILTLVDLLAAETAVTLERIGLLTRLETVARTDELTGLPNRRAWQEHLPPELELARRSAQPICVAMLDLDHFKRFNDERGHQAGDRMLKEMAVAWAGQLRGTDFLSRYGGEEFALSLPGCGVDDALAVVERLRAAIPIGQSCSAGVACWDGQESAADLLDRADRALYDAKRRGRDRILLAAAG